jgi:hypothetical protein
MYADIKTHDADWVSLEATYHAPLTLWLKSNIPTRARRWLPTDKLWLIRIDHVSRLKETLSTMGYEVVDRREYHSDPSTFVAMLEACPLELREKVYRALVLTLHPDQGGDLRLIQDLNIAWNQLKV